MLSSRDAEIIRLWVEKYPNMHTRCCYQFYSERLMKHAKKPLSRITLSDLQSFAQELISSELVPISRVQTLAAVLGRNRRPTKRACSPSAIGCGLPASKSRG